MECGIIKGRVSLRETRIGGFASASIICLSAVAVSATPIVSDIRELKRLEGYGESRERTFRVEGRVLALDWTAESEGPKSFLLDDGTDRMQFFRTQTNALPALAVGDLVTVSGTASPGWSTDLYNDIITPRLSVLVKAHGPAPTFSDISLSELTKPQKDFLLVRTEGTVVDVFPDEIDERTVLLQVRDGQNTISVTADAELPELKDISQLLDARVRVSGLFARNLTGDRIFLGPHIDLNRIEILTPSDPNPRCVPALNPVGTTDPRVIVALPRRSVVGTVLAVRSGGRLILRTSRERIVNVALASGIPPPSCGRRIRVAGRPTTDLYHVNLTHAFWCGEDPDAAALPKATACSARALLPDKPQHDARLASRHGQAVRLTGTVGTVGPGPHGAARFMLESDGVSVPVERPDTVRCPPPGSFVEASGIWVYDIDNWRPDAVLPRISGCALVLRTPADLTVLMEPPWWTPGRLWTLVGALVALLSAIFAWNRVLRRLIDRRSRALYRESLALAKSELRVGERTRLAVELHDSLSQNLEGVACQVSATRSILAVAPEAVGGCLDTAERMLDSCRTELRRCLFDLRGNALESRDFAEALRRTLDPLALKTAIDIRFPVRTAPFDDAQVHAILCVVRELVTNAVRHGHAANVRIAGDGDGGTLVFSVTDDGTGFDPSNRPGPEDGHFGLQGIRDRLRRLDGSLSVESRPGGPTAVTVRIKIPVPQ